MMITHATRNKTTQEQRAAAPESAVCILPGVDCIYTHTYTYTHETEDYTPVGLYRHADRFDRCVSTLRTAYQDHNNGR